MLFIKTACYIDVQNSSIPRSQEPVVFPRFIRNASYSYVISLRHIRKRKYDSVRGGAGLVSRRKPTLMMT